MSTQPLVLDPNGKIVHLLRQKRGLDWFQDPQAVSGAMSGGPGGMQLFQHIWAKSCRDRIITRAEKGLPQVQSDLVLVLGDEFMDLSGAERDELYGGGRGARPDDSARPPRDGGNSGRWAPDAPPPDAPPASSRAPSAPPAVTVPPASASASAPTSAPLASPALDPRDLEAWLDASVHTVLRGMRTPLLQNELTRQPMAYEATAIAWATIGLHRESISLDDLPIAIQRWVTADMLVRQQPERATREQFERRAMVDALFAAVGMGHAKAPVAKDEGGTVRSMWRRERGETAPPPPAPAPAPAARPKPPAASAVITTDVTETDGELPPEPEPGFLLEEYLIPDDFQPAATEPAAHDAVGQAAPESAVEVPSSAPIAAVRVTQAVESPARVTPAAAQTHVRVWSATEPEAVSGRLVASGVDWVRLVDETTGKVVRVRDLHRMGGPAIEDLDGTGQDQFFANGVETPVMLPPALRADPTFMARWTPRWEAAQRPADAWDLLAATWYEDFNETARDGYLGLLTESPHASDRIFADALRTGFGAPLDGPTEGM